jgi:hypothetical protein
MPKESPALHGWS